MDFIQTVQMTNTLMLHKYIQNSLYQKIPTSIIALQFDFDDIELQYRMLYYIERLRKRIFCLPIDKNRVIFTIDTTLEQAILLAKTIQSYLKTKFNYIPNVIGITSFEETRISFDNARDMIARVEKFLELSDANKEIVYGSKFYNSTENVDYVSLFKYIVSNSYKISLVQLNKIDGEYTKSDVLVKYLNENIIIEADIKDFIYLYNSGAKEIILKNDYLIGRIIADIKKFDFDKSEIICNNIRVDTSYLFKRANKRIVPKQNINVQVANGREEIIMGSLIDFSKSSISISIPKELITAELMENLKSQDLFVFFTIENTKLIISADFYSIKERDNDNVVLILFLFLEKDTEEFIDNLYKNEGLENIKKAKLELDMMKSLKV